MSCTTKFILDHLQRINEDGFDPDTYTTDTVHKRRRDNHGFAVNSLRRAKEHYEEETGDSFDEVGDLIELMDHARDVLKGGHRVEPVAKMYRQEATGLINAIKTSDRYANANNQIKKYIMSGIEEFENFLTDKLNAEFAKKR